MHFFKALVPLIGVFSSLGASVPVLSGTPDTSLDAPGIHPRVPDLDTLPGPSCPFNASSHVSSIAHRDISRGWYNRAEGEWLLKQAEKDVNYFPIIEALWRLTRILNHKRIPWAVSGGLAFKLFGAKRFTTDIDIIVETDMDTLRHVMGKDPHVVLPDYRTDAHLRVFANIGMPECSGDRWIEIDMIIAGGLNTSPDVRANSQTIAKDTRAGDYPNHGEFPIHVIRVNQLFISKVHALAAAHRKKDEKDLADISWVIDNKPGALVNIENKLDWSLRTLVVRRMRELRIGDYRKAAKLLRVD